MKMKMKMMVGILLVTGLMIGSGFAASKAKPKSTSSAVLIEGNYSAKARALVCGGCGSLIEKAMGGIQGIEAVSVDQKTSMVHFTVKRGARINQVTLQKALKSSADQMGMGADYSLLDLKKVN